jgi:[protein-PII] uridylyltransferase
MQNDLTPAGIRQEIADHRSHQESQWHDGLRGSQLERENSDFFDDLARRICADVAHSLPEASPWMGCALGGYGRRALAPGSDLDLLFFSQAPLEEGSGIHEIARQVLYRLWDSQVDVTAVVRSCAECRAQLASGDVRSQTALLDVRHIVGSRDVWECWQARARSVCRGRRWQKRFVPAKWRELERRRQQCGASPFFLEPNVKDGEGGLRDWQTLWWIGRALQHIGATEDLAKRGWVTAPEWTRLRQAVEMLTDIRWGLHTLAGRKQDRLGFVQQEQLAQERTSVEGLMRDYYQSAAVIRDSCDWLVARWRGSPRWDWRRVWCQRATQRQWYRRARHVIMLPERCQTVAQAEQFWHGVVTSEIALSAESRHHLWRIAATLSSTSQAAEMPQCFTSPRSVTRFLRELHRTNWLEYFFPEFRPLRFRAQRDAYHCFTIDTHLIEAVDQCAQLLTADAPSCAPEVVHARTMLPDAEALLVASLYHDAGKGVGRPHAQTGVGLVQAAAQRYGWGTQRIALVKFLVRSHQIMTQLAFTRDCHDPDLIEQFAESVGSVERLAALYLLTLSDLKAVGPNVYTSWKGALLADLYRQTVQAMAGDIAVGTQRLRTDTLITEVQEATATPDVAALVPRWLEGMPSRYHTHMSPPEIARHVQLWFAFGDRSIGVLHACAETRGTVTVDFLASNVSGLFAKLCGVLASHQMNIVAAQTYTGRHGFVIDRFICQPSSHYGLQDVWSRLERDAHEVVQGYRRLEPLLDRRRGGVLASEGRIAVTPRVRVDNAISEEFTVVDVEAGDRLGLLYEISTTFFAEQCDIMSAKVTTVGHRVHDAFYIQDADGGKILDPQRLEHITEIVRQRLAQ